MESNGALLEVEGLNVGFKTDDGILMAASDINFYIRSGETLAMVGESGSGKSVTALAIMRLHPKTARIAGRARLLGKDLLAMSDDEMREVRGNDISMIFQDPMTALNPVFTVGSQIVEAIRIHQNVSKDLAWSRAVDLLALVGVPEPKRRAAQYPHEFSGGMRQRAMIAMAIANDPKLLIADEPTTALDVTVQAQVMEVIADVQKATGAAVLLITHDLGLVAGSADRVQVMYASRIFESGSLEDIFYSSSNPYTQALMASIPAVTTRTHQRLASIPGNPPSLLKPPPGCPFMPRCSMAIEGCDDGIPASVEVAPAHFSRCIRAEEFRLAGAGGVAR
ncbi:MAG: ABC transporter ATP-binding protein [Ilumatobacteraceae bacterium]|nr:MAG: ABC transporter ATP-binding protein [Actinomycetota bacterium]